jgi:hypothetical protein
LRQPTIANDNAKESLSIGITQGPDQFQQLRNQNWNMPFLQIVITLVLGGLLLWLVNRFIPMQSTTMKSILNGFAVIVAVLWLLTLFGGFTPSLVRTLEAERNIASSSSMPSAPTAESSPGLRKTSGQRSNGTIPKRRSGNEVNNEPRWSVEIWRAESFRAGFFPPRWAGTQRAALHLSDW